MKVFRVVLSSIISLSVIFLIVSLAAATPPTPTKHHPIIESVVIKEAGEKGFTLNMEFVKTEGNFSYIPLNLVGMPSENQKYVLMALAAFERQFSLRVTWFNIENHNIWSLTYGIWVKHEPKQTP